MVDGLTDVDSATWQDIAEGAEQALFARFRELDTPYKNQFRVILSGLKERGNGYLLRKIAHGEVKAGQLAMMSREELEPPLWVGHIHQQGLTKFLARAHRVSGNCARLPEVRNVLVRVRRMLVRVDRVVMRVGGATVGQRVVVSVGRVRSGGGT